MFIQKLFRYLALSGILLLSLPLPAQEPFKYLYKSGEEGYKCFRIPAIVATRSGTLLAFAEGRKNNCGDAGPSAYSNLVELPNGKLACFFEAGVKSAYEGIVFQEVSISPMVKISL